MSQRNRWLIRIFFIGWMAFLWIFVKQPYEFLLLNTFLGYIPIELGFHLNASQPKSRVIFWITFVIWLLFYPNAPYMLTDLFHLSLLSPYAADGLLKLSIHMWAYFSFMLISTLFCTVFGMWSLGHVSNAIAGRLANHHIWARNLIIIVLTVLSSIGIFIGRFLRIHTIYLITSPNFIVNRLMTMWTPKMLMFVVILSIMQLLIFGFFSLIRQTPKFEDK
ncbi:DUF1361 domain-containing protein [Secundilactobacillus malefermentans]|uniref:DUF1361 domain-containing protein n=1 Tax=Secundilactobacillus malefermentans TaxID=176292 RepID=A0A4V3A3N3_9LACO|nr:DUF1361 domain-containing protein [Secundilactobacillus malefermentans]TDG75235.1 hypothetical protein C5L31_000152 [Secundilactobacillus malefermentans]